LHIPFEEAPAAMNPTVQRLLESHYPPEDDVYFQFEREVGRVLTSSSVLVDAGCGRTAATLRRFAPHVHQAIGIDEIDFTASGEEKLTLLKGDLHHVPLPGSFADVVIARSVVEHLDDPLTVYREFYRVLKPGGRFFLITPNRLHYAMIAASLIPNRFHSRVVKFGEGRPEEDTFPTRYRSNTRGAIHALATRTGFAVRNFTYLGECPHYLVFHPLAFRLGMAYDRLTRNVPGLAPLRRWITAELQKPFAPATAGIAHDGAAVPR
jgi:SAM-dependent methyltransferase